jgi:hypothetical protein
LPILSPPNNISYYCCLQKHQHHLFTIVTIAPLVNNNTNIPPKLTCAKRAAGRRGGCVFYLLFGNTRNIRIEKSLAGPLHTRSKPLAAGFCA